MDPSEPAIGAVDGITKQNFVLWRYLNLQSSKCSNMKGTKHPQLNARETDHFTKQLEFENNLDSSIPL